MAVRLRRAPGPPSGPFELNDASVQAAGLRLCLHGTANDLTSGRPYTVLAAAPTIVITAIGQALSFSSSPIRFASLPNPGTTAVTIAAWINAANMNALFDGGPSQVDCRRAYGSRFEWQDAQGPAVTLPGGWAHVCGIYTVGTTNKSITSYLNGVSLGTGTGGDQSANWSNFTIGSVNTNFQYFSGLLKDFRVYYRALSDSEIYQLYDPATRWELYAPLQRVWQVAWTSTEVQAQAAITLGALTVAATAVAPVAAQGSVTLGALTLAAQAVAPVTAQASVTLGALTVSAAGESTVTAQASITLGGLVVAGVAVVLVQGAASITLGALTLSATAAEAEITYTVLGSIVGVAGAGTIEGPSAAGTLRGW